MLCKEVVVTLQLKAVVHWSRIGAQSERCMYCMKVTGKQGIRFDGGHGGRFVAPGSKQTKNDVRGPWNLTVTCTRKPRSHNLTGRHASVAEPADARSRLRRLEITLGRTPFTI